MQAVSQAPSPKVMSANQVMSAVSGSPRARSRPATIVNTNASTLAE